MSAGWIKLYRKITVSWIWSEKPYSKGQAFIDILLRANHKFQKISFGNQIIEVNPGETVWSVLDMASHWGWSRTKTQAFLNLLESDKMLVQKKTSKYTVLSIVNYNSYQDSSETEKQQKDNKKTSTKQQKDINNNIKKVKNEMNENNIESDFEFLWKLYNKESSGKKKCYHLYSNLSNEAKQKMRNHIPDYVASTPDAQFRKNFENYIMNECWNDEIIQRLNNTGKPVEKTYNPVEIFTIDNKQNLKNLGFEVVL